MSKPVENSYSEARKGEVSLTLLKGTDYYHRKNNIQINFKRIRCNDVSDLVLSDTKVRRVIPSGIYRRVIRCQPTNVSEENVVLQLQG